MPILVKGHDIRSGTKANTRHSRLQAAWELDLPQVDLMNFRVDLGREAAERATKSQEVFVRRVLNKQAEGLFRKSIRLNRDKGIAGPFTWEKVMTFPPTTANKKKIKNFYFCRL